MFVTRCLCTEFYVPKQEANSTQSEPNGQNRGGNMEARREAADNLKAMLRISKRQVALYNVLKTTMRLKRMATDEIANSEFNF